MVAQNQRTPGDQVFWPKVVLKKWLNLRSKDAKFNADEDDGDDDGEQEENCGCDGAGAEREAGGVGIAGELFFLPHSYVSSDACSYPVLKTGKSAALDCFALLGKHR